MAHQFYATDISGYVSGSGIKSRLPVKTVATSNQNLAVTAVGVTLNGYTLVAGDRYLVTAQTTGSENGVYVAANPPYRAEDYDVNSDTSYAFLCVTSGTYANTEWQAIGSGIVGTGSQGFVMRNIMQYTKGDIVYASSTSTLAKLSKPTTTSIMQMDSSGNVAWIDQNTVTAGLSPKDSVNFGTLLNVGGTYSASGGTAATGAFTNIDFTSGTIFNKGAFTISVGDRILVKNQTDSKQNGIYSVTTAGATGAMQRAADQNGVPANTITAGDFTFIQFDGTGWILQGERDLVPNTDNLVWSQFNAATVYTAGNGISINSFTVSANLKTAGGIAFQSGQLALSLGDNSITGTLAVTNGGTGLSTITSGNLLLGNGTSAVSLLAPTSRKVLATNSTPGYILTNDINLNSILGQASALTVLGFTDVASAVNNLSITNAITGNAPTLSATGTDTNVSLAFTSKGTGSYNFNGKSGTSAEIRIYEDTANGVNYTGLKAASNLTANTTFTLPSSDGTSGQVIRTNGSGVLSFVPVSINTSLAADAIIIANTTAQIIAYFAFDITKYGASASCNLYFESVNGAAFNIIIKNETATTTINTTTVSSSAFNTVSFTGPSANARVSISVVKNAAGVSPIIYGLQLGIN